MAVGESVRHVISPKTKFFIKYKFALKFQDLSGLNGNIRALRVLDASTVTKEISRTGENKNTRFEFLGF
jgi:hypothetical protein